MTPEQIAELQRTLENIMARLYMLEAQQARREEKAEQERNAMSSSTETHGYVMFDR